MRVLVFSSAYPNSHEDYNGIFVQEQVKAIKNNNIDIEVVGPIPLCPFPVYLFSDKWKAFAKTPLNEMRSGVTVTRPKFLSLPRNLLLANSSNFMEFALKPIIKNIGSDFDLFHAHYAFPMGYAVAKLAKALSKPFILTTHGLDTAYMVHHSAKVRHKTIHAFKNANHIISVSPKIKSDLLDLGVSENSVSVIGNGVQFDDGLNSVRVARWEHNRKFILSVSNLIPSKGIDLNIKAFAQFAEFHRDYMYVIIGDGAERANLEALTSSLGISNNVVFLGSLPHSDVVNYMSLCDIFSLPSWSEGFGIVYIEAMFAGKPTIACQGEGMEGLIISGKNGILVKKKDVTSLRDALCYLVNNPETAKRMGNVARNKIIDEYTWDKISKKICRIYYKVINE